MISLKNTLKAITSKFSALNTLLNDVPHYTLLWTNPNPTSSFSAQTISLDLSKYDAVAVVNVRWATTTTIRRFFNTTLVLDKNQDYAMTCGGQEYLRFRSVRFSNTGVTFGAGATISGYGGSDSTANEVSVPIKIYGIKFGGGYSLKALLRSLFAKGVAVC